MANTSLPTARRIAAELGPADGPIDAFAAGTGQVADSDLMPLYVALDDFLYDLQAQEMREDDDALPKTRSLSRAKSYVESEMRTRGLWPKGW